MNQHDGYFVQVSTSSVFVANSERFFSVQLTDDFFLLGFGKEVDFPIKEASETCATAYSILSKKNFYYDSRGRLIDRLWKASKRTLERKGVDMNLFGWGMVVCSNRAWWVTHDESIAPYHVRSKICRSIDTFDLAPFSLNIHASASAQKIFTGDLVVGDSIVLVSQDVHLTVNQTQLLDIFSKTETLENKCKNLILKAQKRRQGLYAVLAFQKT